MHTLHNGYRGLSLLVDVNWERLMYPAMIAMALAAGAFVGSLQY